MFGKEDKRRGRGRRLEQGIKWKKKKKEEKKKKKEKRWNTSRRGTKGI